MSKNALRTLAQPITVSEAAIELCTEAELIDLHIDTFIPYRLWGYDPLKKHKSGPFGRHFFGHLDLPRMQEGGLNGAMWSITTNPFRWPTSRWKTFIRNLEDFKAMVDKSNKQLAFATSVTEYRELRKHNAHAVLLSIQGGNALEAAPNGAKDIPDRIVTRVTLIHLTNSVYGATSSPDHYLRKKKGLSQSGLELIEQLNSERIFVDLAHIHPQGFWDALSVHKTDLPPIATHTGVDGGRVHWRNLDDDQLRAIADRGGVVGVIFAANFLKRRGMANTAEMVVHHLEHVIKVAGESTAAIGSDLDGAISPPPDLSSGFAYVALVDAMLNRGWTEKRIRGIMAENFLKSWAHLRP